MCLLIISHYSFPPDDPTKSEAPPSQTQPEPTQPEPKQSPPAAASAKPKTTPSSQGKPPAAKATPPDGPQDKKAREFIEQAEKKLKSSQGFFGSIFG